MCLFLEWENNPLWRLEFYRPFCHVGLLSVHLTSLLLAVVRLLYRLNVGIALQFYNNKSNTLKKKIYDQYIYFKDLSLCIF